MDFGGMYENLGNGLVLLLPERNGVRPDGSHREEKDPAEGPVIGTERYRGDLPAFAAALNKGLKGDAVGLRVVFGGGVNGGRKAEDACKFNAAHAKTLPQSLRQRVQTVLFSITAGPSAARCGRKSRRYGI